MDPSGTEARMFLRSRRRALERGRGAKDEARAEISEIDAALARIDAGSYGGCEGCGGAIGRSRLRALPEVRLCAGCSSGSGRERAIEGT